MRYTALILITNPTPPQSSFLAHSSIMMASAALDPSPGDLEPSGSSSSSCLHSYDRPFVLHRLAHGAGRVAGLHVIRVPFRVPLWPVEDDRFEEDLGIGTVELWYWSEFWCLMSGILGAVLVL